MLFESSGSDSGAPAIRWGASPAGEPHAPRERDYVLRHQVARLRFDWERRAVVGATELHLAAAAHPVSVVELDAVGLTVRAARDAAGRELGHRTEGHTLAVTLSAPLQPGDSTVVALEYEAVRPASGVAFVARPRVAWAQGKLEEMRFWLPTDDRPAAKPTWDITVRAGKGERAYASGRLADTRDAGNGATDWRWVVDRPTPAFLLAVAVGALERVAADDASGRPRAALWIASDSASAARQDAVTAAQASSFFAERLGIPFPAAGVEQVAVPAYPFWNWLENWRPYVTAAVLDEQLVLDGARGWPGETSDIAIARVVAQHWFGALVTPKDWSHVWLNEGLTSFLAYTWFEEVHGREDASHLWEWAHVSAFAADRDARRPLVYDRWKYGPAELLRTEHAGQRGAVVLRMLRRRLGDAAFWGGLRRFLTEQADGTATTADLQRAFEAESGTSLDTFFRQWVYGAGFPLLHITAAYDTAARRLHLSARQTQDRDTLTGLFDVDVDVEVYTDAGVERVVMPLRGEVNEHDIPLSSPLRSVRWDPEQVLLSHVEFERPEAWLTYQLQHARDARGKDEAARELASLARGMQGPGPRAIMFTSDNVPGLENPDAMATVIATLRTDPSPRGRAAAAQAMSFSFDPASEAALIEATRDSDAAVRGTAAMSLFGLPTPARMERLRELVASDPDANVRRAADFTLRMMSSAAEAAHMPTRSRNAASVPPVKVEATSEEALATLEALSFSRSGEEWATARRLLTTPDFDRRVRQSAMRALSVAVFMERSRPQAHAGELVSLLTPFLSDDDPSTRVAAARELSNAKIPAATATLEARKRIEADARVLDEIDASLRAIARKDDFPRR